MPRLDGIDIAHYQWEAGPTDLAVVAAIPTFWFATKATQSTAYVDPTFARARAAAAPAGFTHVGLYHWLSSTKDPVQQAAHYLRTIGTLHRTEFCMLDAEEGGITMDGCLAFCEAVENVTRRPVVVYSGLYVAGGTIWRSVPLRASRFGPRPFIVAAYVSEANLAARLKATNSPAPHAWQYSSNGPVAGITGRCDMDMIHDRAAFDLACGITDPAPVPRPPSPSPGDPDMADVRLLKPSGTDAQFIATCGGPKDATGKSSVATSCRWTGDGGDPKVQAKVAAHYAAGMTDLTGITVGDLINVALDGLLPPGMSADQFANTEEILARMTSGTVDRVARDGLAIVSADLAVIDSQVDKIRAGLITAAS